jgi:hypothetical protein
MDSFLTIVFYKITMFAKLSMVLTLSMLIFSCKVPESQESFLFSADSGFITKKIAMDLLKKYPSINNFQTLSFATYITDNDTVGKYFTDSKTKNKLILFAFTFTQQNLLLEIDSSNSLINSHLFQHSIYNCCIDNINEGFRRLGNFYYVRVCGTGLGHCSTHFYLFPNFNKVSSEEFYEKSHTLSTDNKENFIQSKLEIFENKLLLNYYTYMVDYDKYDSISDTYKKNDEKNTTIQYFYENGTWTTSDSLLLVEIGIFFN